MTRMDEISGQAEEDRKSGVFPQKVSGEHFRELRPTRSVRIVACGRSARIKRMISVYGQVEPREVHVRYVNDLDEPGRLHRRNPWVGYNEERAFNCCRPCASDLLRGLSRDIMLEPARLCQFARHCPPPWRQTSSARPATV